jgi:hypothetical protein
MKAREVRSGFLVVAALLVGLASTAFAQPIHSSLENLYSTGGTTVTGCTGEGCEQFNANGNGSFGDVSGVIRYEVSETVFQDIASNQTAFSYTVFNDGTTNDTVTSFSVPNDGVQGTSTPPPGWTFVSSSTAWSWATADPANGIPPGPGARSLNFLVIIPSAQVGVTFSTPAIDVNADHTVQTSSNWKISAPVTICPATEPNSATSRAYGVRADVPALNAAGAVVQALLHTNPGPLLINPTPDTDVPSPPGAPSPFLTVPASPVLLANVLTAVAHQASSSTAVSSDATATTADVHVLDPGTGFIVNAAAVVASVTCNADGTTAGSSLSGSKIEGLQIGGMNFDTITEPTTIKVIDPITKTTVEVDLLEKIESGAKAGEIQPNPVTHAFESDLTVNGIHVKVTDPSGNIIADVIVAHAECKAAFGPVCEDFPHVSGSGYVVGVNADETLIDPLNQLLHNQIGTVRLPSTGGSDDSTLKQIGPIGGMGTTLVNSGTAFSHTEGTISNNGNTASSATISEVEKLKLIDNGTSPTNPFLGADVVRAECTAQAGPLETGSTTGKTTIVGATLGGSDICAGLGLAPTAACPNSAICCEPPPNTDVCAALGLTPLCSGLGLTVTLNEQLANPASMSGDPNAITVNAIHVHLGGAIPGSNGADVIVSNAHCDAGTKGTTEPPLPSYYGGLSMNEAPSRVLAFLFSAGAVGLLIPRRRKEGTK